MFNIGFMEIVVIGVIALLVLGPEQLPSVAKVLGKFIGELKRATDEFKTEFTSTTKETRDVVTDLKNKVQSTINDSLKNHEFHGPDGRPISNPHLNGHHADPIPKPSLTENPSGEAPSAVIAENEKDEKSSSS